MKKLIKTMAVLAAIAMMFGTVACSHSDDDDDDYVSSTESTSTSSTASSSITETITEDSSTEVEDEEYTLDLEEGCKQLTIYYYRSSGYDGCDIWMWCDGGAALNGQTLHECSYGTKVVVNVPEDTAKVGFMIRTNLSEPGGTQWEDSAILDGTSENRFIYLTRTYTTIYTIENDPNYYSSAEDAMAAWAESQTTTTE